MSSCIEVMVIVEGKTEEIFIKNLVSPYLARNNIFMHATQISKPGQKGGDVKFERAKRDFGNHLKQRPNTYVTLFVDYYGIKSDWPGLNDVRKGATPKEIAETINGATKAKVVSLFGEQLADERFIPFIAVYEFEALLFSDAEILSSSIGVSTSRVDADLTDFGEPEAINNSPETAPSKRLDAWSKGSKFRKTTTGITIAQEIGIEKMREKCPLFNQWLITFETIQKKYSS
jgi:hypothetical protein